MMWSSDLQEIREMVCSSPGLFLLICPQSMAIPSRLSPITPQKSALLTARYQEYRAFRFT